MQGKIPAMAETRWCPRCGSEYRPGTETCADCGVPLVDIGPSEPKRAAAPPGDSDEDLVATRFDLTEWDDDSLNGVSWMLGGARIPFEWERHGVLLVADAWADEAESFIDYVASGDEDVELDPSDDDWRGAAATPIGQAVQLTSDEFYDGDPARLDSEEVLYGQRWSDEKGIQCEVTWVHDTGELFIMSAPPRLPLQVEVLADIPTQEEVDRLLDGWEDAMTEPNSIEWVRERVRQRGAAPAVPDAAESLGQSEVAGAVDQLDASLESDAPWWDPPASIGWITPHLDDLRSAYLLARSTMESDDALDMAIGGLDDGAKSQLEDFLGGEMDVVYGKGTGAQTRTDLRDALERQVSAKA